MEFGRGCWGDPTAGIRILSSLRFCGVPRWLGEPDVVIVTLGLDP